MRKVLATLILTLALGAGSTFAQDTGGETITGGMTGGTMSTAELSATTNNGVPEAFTEDRWQEASGTATITSQSAEQYTLRLEASGLVPEGLYTTWYVNPGIAGSPVGREVGPAGDLPNDFRADAEGNATFELTVPADNDYQNLVVAYHADDMTHGDSPGETGEVTFGHLMTSFPAPSN